MSEDRLVYHITGGDRIRFLQGLVTNDTAGLAEGLVYAALLTPQGKWLADFFVIPTGEVLLLGGLRFVVLHTKGGLVRWFKVTPAAADESATNS